MAMRRVQLFSKPQQTVAPSTKSEPFENRNASEADVPSNESRMLAAVTKAMAAQSRLLTFSRKNSRAMRAVATISKLLSNAVLAAELMRKPYIIRMGAAMSRTTIAAA